MYPIVLTCCQVCILNNVYLNIRSNFGSVRPVYRELMLNRCNIMNENASVSQYIYTHSGSTLVETLAWYDRGSRFEPSSRQGLSSFSFFLFALFFYNVQIALWIGIHEVYDKKLFDNKTLPPNNCVRFIHTVYMNLFFKCETKTHTKNMNYSINTVAI